MFSLDDKVVYPGHGVATVHRIVLKEIAGTVTACFELKFLTKDMTILVPTNNLLLVGVRRLSSLQDIEEIFNVLTQPVTKLPYEVHTVNWNRRSKHYKAEMRKGNPKEICKIYRDLKYIAHYKELSFGEKTLLAQIELLLAQEISLVKNIDQDKVIEQLRSLFIHAPTISASSLVAPVL